MSNPVILVALAVASVTLSAQPGVDVAKRQVAFARLATEAKLRISTDLETLDSQLEKNHCLLSAEIESTIPSERRHLAQAFAAEYCAPWGSLWNSVLDACDADQRPDWCADEAAVLAHLDLDGYFQTLVDAVRTSSSPLERDNIVDCAIAAFRAHAIGEFCPDHCDKWSTALTEAYLHNATSDDVATIALELHSTWVRITPGTNRLIRAYLSNATGISLEQRTQIEALLAQ